MKKTSTMRDANGNDIPVKYVSAYDRQRDRTARRIRARFEKARRMLEAVVVESAADLRALKVGKDRPGEKGNFQTSSFDGLIRVAIKQQYCIRLDERVISARDLMLGYVKGVLDRVNGVDTTALRLLVENAFKANSSGYLSTAKVLALIRMEVNDPKWRAAKEILQAAIMPQKGKRYLACEVRASTQEDFRAIRLDLADCWPAVAAAPEAE